MKRIRFSLQSILYFVTLVGVLLAWHLDRSALKQKTIELNNECAKLFRSQNVVTEMHFKDGMATHFGRGFAPIGPDFRGLYDASDPEDRANYKAGRARNTRSGPNSSR